MNFLIDTCVLSELVKTAPSKLVTDWLAGVPEEQLFLSVITLGELRKGIAKLPSSARRARLQQWVENDLRERFENKILDITPEVAESWGEMLGEAEAKGRKVPAIDALIAATARIHRLTVVTRNTGDLQRCGVDVFDPWSPQ